MAPLEEMAKMNAAADEAKADLAKMIEDDPNLLPTVLKLAAWWKKWFMKAGHKRLGRILTYWN